MVGRKFTGSSGALMDRLIELQRQRDEEGKRMAGMFGN
jgi:hypothetical protein